MHPTFFGRTPFRAVMLASALTAAPVVGALAQPTVASEANAVLERYRAAVGAAQLGTIRTMKSTGVMQMPAAGISAPLVIEQQAPNKMLMSLEIPGMGAMRSGYDGTVGWSVNPMQGPRVMTGVELTDLEASADLRTMTREAAIIAAATLAGDTTVANEPCTRVALTFKSGRKSTDCFAKQSGLLVASWSKQAMGGGEMDVMARYSDYRAVGPIQMPYTTTMSMMGQEQSVKLTTVETNGTVSDLTTLPKEIAPLVKKP